MHPSSYFHFITHILFFFENIKKKIAEVNEKLNGDGRVVVRPSGTENLIRVMLEGKDEEIIKSYCENLANYIENELK